MADESKHGSILGVPYDFRRPSLKRFIDAHWRPDESMLVAKPFGIGYTLNLANWRSWAVLAITGLLFWQQRRSQRAPEDNDEAVEVIVD
jgi:hypothetical protein